MPLQLGGDLTRALTAVQLALTMRLRAALADAGCTVEEWWVLDLVAERPGRPMNEVAGHVMLPASTLTKLIDRMVEQENTVQVAAE